MSVADDQRTLQVPLGVALVTLAAAIMAAGGVLADPAEGWTGLLTAGVFCLQIALGGVLLFAIQSASCASWWKSFRLESLGLGRGLPVGLAVVLGCLALGHETLYPWAREGFHAGTGKRVWLNTPMVLARAVIIAAVWLGLWQGLRRAVCRSEATIKRSAIAFIVVYAVTQTVAAWDWLMSLEPAWYSTMYSVYVFGGTLVAGIAAVIVRMSWARETRLNSSQRHDLGKLLFAFSTFWAYLWFCQFLLIWYSNLPEETDHFAKRLSGGWGTLFWLNPILSFVVPFVLLLPAAAKRNGPVLLRVALLVLVGRWIDIYLLVAPSVGPPPAWPLSAFASTLATVGLAAILVGRRRDADPAPQVRA